MKLSIAMKRLLWMVADLICGVVVVGLYLFVLTRGRILS
jgi:hypothetical protein